MGLSDENGTIYPDINDWPEIIIGDGDVSWKKGGEELSPVIRYGIPGEILFE